MNRLIIILLSLTLSGCLITQWEDVSGENEFTQLIGKTITSNSELYIYGITMQSNYDKILDHYTVKDFKYGGREVLSSGILPSGTKFKITKVVRCVDCPFKYEKLELKVLLPNKYLDAPVFVHYKLYVNIDKALFN